MAQLDKGDVWSLNVDQQAGTTQTYTMTTAGTYTDRNIALTVNTEGYEVVSKEADGLCPQLPNETETKKFLRQDGEWAEPDVIVIDTNDIPENDTVIYGKVTRYVANKKQVVLKVTNWMSSNTIYANYSHTETIEDKNYHIFTGLYESDNMYPFYANFAITDSPRDAGWTWNVMKFGRIMDVERYYANSEIDPDDDNWWLNDADKLVSGQKVYNYVENKTEGMVESINGILPDEDGDVHISFVSEQMLIESESRTREGYTTDKNYTTGYCFKNNTKTVINNAYIAKDNIPVIPGSVVKWYPNANTKTERNGFIQIDKNGNYITGTNVNNYYNTQTFTLTENTYYVNASWYYINDTAAKVGKLTIVKDGEETLLWSTDEGTYYPGLNDKASNAVVSKTANGLCPRLPNETSTTKFLCQNGTWQENKGVYYINYGDTDLSTMIEKHSKGYPVKCRLAGTTLTSALEAKGYTTTSPNGEIVDADLVQSKTMGLFVFETVLDVQKSVGEDEYIFVTLNVQIKCSSTGYWDLNTQEFLTKEDANNWTEVSQSDYMTLASGRTVQNFYCYYNKALKLVSVSFLLTADDPIPATAFNATTIGTVNQKYRPVLPAYATGSFYWNGGYNIPRIYGTNGAITVQKIDNGSSGNYLYFVISGTYATA